MSKKSEKKNQVATAAAEEKETTPVAQPAKAVQLTPIIQPIAFVPYSTQDQALYMEDEVEETEVEEIEEEVVAPKKKKVSCAAIFLSIFSLLIIGVYVAGNFVLQDYLALVGGVSGYGIIMELIETMEFTNIANLVIAIAPVMALLTIIASLIRIMKKGACVFAKITTFIGLVAIIAAVVLALINQAEIGYGLYAVAVLSLVNVLIAYLAKND